MARKKKKDVDIEIKEVDIKEEEAIIDTAITDIPVEETETSTAPAEESKPVTLTAAKIGKLPPMKKPAVAKPQQTQINQKSSVFNIKTVTEPSSKNAKLNEYLQMVYSLGYDDGKLGKNKKTLRINDETGRLEYLG